MAYLIRIKSILFLSPLPFHLAGVFCLNVLLPALVLVVSLPTGTLSDRPGT